MKSEAVPHANFREGCIVGYQLIKGVGVGVSGASCGDEFVSSRRCCWRGGRGR